MQIIQQSSIDKSVPIQVVISDLVSVIESLKDVSNTNAYPTITLAGSYNRGEEIVRGTVSLTPRNLWVFSKACYPMLLAGIAKGGFQSPELRAVLDGISQIQRAAKVALSQDKWPMFDPQGLNDLIATIKQLPVPQAQQTVTLKK